MKHIKHIREMLDPMGSWDPKQLKDDKKASALDNGKYNIYKDISISMRDGSPIEEIEKLVLSLEKGNKDNLKVAQWAAELQRFHIIELLLENELLEASDSNLGNISMWVSIDHKLDKDEKLVINQRVKNIFNIYR